MTDHPDLWPGIREELSDMAMAATRGVSAVEARELLTHADAMLDVVRATQALDLELGWSVLNVTGRISGWRVKVVEALAKLPVRLK